MLEQSPISQEAAVLHALTVLLLFQLAGEVLSQVLRLPIPGPVVGLALLFLFLSFSWPRPCCSISRCCSFRRGSA